MPGGTGSPEGVSGGIWGLGGMGDGDAGCGGSTEGGRSGLVPGIRARAGGSMVKRIVTFEAAEPGPVVRAINFAWRC